MQADSIQPPAPPTDTLPAEAPIWLPESLVGTWDFLAAYPLVLALVVAVGGILLAVSIRGLILLFGLRITSRTPTKLDEEVVRLLAAVAALLVGYAGLAAAVQALPLSELWTERLTRILLTLLVIQLMRVALRTVSLALSGLPEIRERFPVVEERTVPLFDLAFTIGIVGAGAYFLLEVWELDPVPWLASAGIVGIAVGFAAQETLANLFAGFFIIADRPYVMGDYVVLDTGERGEVTKVGIRSTRILTRDDVEIIIPNSLMANRKVVNESGGPSERFRIRIGVGVAYGSDVDRVVEVLGRVAGRHERVCRTPEPRVRMRGFGDSSLDFELLCWIDHPGDRGLISHELYMDIYRELEREEITIPFPQRDIWVRSTAKEQGDAVPAGPREE